MKKVTNKTIAVLATVAMVVTTMTIGVSDASAAAKPKLNPTKATITVGKTKTIKVKGKKIKKIKKTTWSVKSKKIATLSKKKKTSVKVKGKKAGKTTLTAKIKIGKKTYKATCKLTIKKKAAPVVTPAPAPAPVPVPVPTAAPVPTPVPTPVVTPTPTPVVTPTPTPPVTPSPTPEVVEGESTTLAGAPATSYTLSTEDAYVVTAKNAEGTKTETQNVTADQIQKAMDKVVNVASEYTRWMTTDAYTYDFADVTADVDGAGATKVVTISGTNTRLAGTYNVTLARNGSVYTVDVIRNATGAKYQAVVTEEAEQVRVASTYKGAQYTAVAKKDRSYAELKKAGVLIATITKNADETYTGVVADSYKDKYDVTLSVIKKVD